MNSCFRGDKDIYVYETDAKGKLWRRHKFSGHEGWVTQLLFVSGEIRIHMSSNKCI